MPEKKYPRKPPTPEQRAARREYQNDYRVRNAERLDRWRYDAARRVVARYEDEHPEAANEPIDVPPIDRKKRQAKGNSVSALSVTLARRIRYNEEMYHRPTVWGAYTYQVGKIGTPHYGEIIRARTEDIGKEWIDSDGNPRDAWTPIRVAAEEPKKNDPHRQTSRRSPG